ncbi:MAG: hypothetical protein K5860_11470 [Bacteroidales bacterium]|nr:hypothetical protein [Bacteroidales bacterium]
MEKELDELSKTNEDANNYAGPILMYCWEKEYLSAKKKILFVGQETQGWWDDFVEGEESLKESIKTYEGFELGYSYYPTPFWKALHKINNVINKNDEKNFMWTNVNKFGLGCGPGKPLQIILDKENESFNVLSEEIKILKPDVVIFFTGPYYDGDICKKIKDVEFLEVGNHSIREFSKLKSTILPEKSYRTYHPAYLRKSKQEYIIDELINLIK